MERLPDREALLQRKFARIEVRIDTQIWVETDGRLGPVLKGSILNISAGGGLLMSPEPIPVDAVILVKFTLPEPIGPMLANLQTIQCWESETGDVPPYRVTGRFLDLDDHKQDQIVRFVFQRERERRQRGIK